MRILVSTYPRIIPQFLYLSTLKYFPNRAHKPPVQNTNWEVFRTMIRENLPLDVPLKTDVDVEACVNQFVHIIQQAAWSSTSTPHRTYQVDECAPRIKQKILDKRKLRKRWQTTRSPQDKPIFNQATHELKLLNDLKQQAIQSFLESLTATEATEYSLWKATKRLNRPQTHIPHYALQREAGRRVIHKKHESWQTTLHTSFNRMTPRYLT